MCHCRWLDPDHKWRYNKIDFDGTHEFRAPPNLPSGAFALRQMKYHGFWDWSPWKKVFFHIALLAIDVPSFSSIF